MMSFKTLVPMISPNFISRSRSSLSSTMCFFGTRFLSISFSAFKNSIWHRRSSSVEVAKRNSNGENQLFMEDTFERKERDFPGDKLSEPLGWHLFSPLGLSDQVTGSLPSLALQEILRDDKTRQTMLRLARV